MTVFVEQVAAELARPVPSSLVIAQWQSWIDRAYRLIQTRLGDSYAAADQIAVDDVVLVAVAEHIRAWRDNAASQYTISVDDASTTRTYAKSAGLLEIPDNLWSLLGVGVSESFTIGP